MDTYKKALGFRSRTSLILNFLECFLSAVYSILLRVYPRLVDARFISSATVILSRGTLRSNLRKQAGEQFIGCNINKAMAN